MVAVTPSPLPSSLLDALLRMAPLDVLLFDTDLVCRYAALAEGSLFGRTPDQFIGRPAAEIFPPANGDLRTALTLAAESAAVYNYRPYRYTLTTPEPQTFFCWSVRIEAVSLADYRGREEFRGVLVTLADVQDLADDNDRMTREVDRLQREVSQLRQQMVAAERREAAHRESRLDLRSVVGNLLTPAMGYLQLLSRRPHVLRGQPLAQTIEEKILPELRRIVEAMADDDQAPPPIGDR